MLELIVALLAGILVGTFTGLAPGIHINLVSAILISLLPSLQLISPLALAVFIVCMAITHTFIDFVPSVYLGAPEEDTFLSVLPGHEMLMEGKGHEAVVLTLYGSITAIIVSLILFFPLIYLLPIIENKILFFMPFILIFISSYMIFKESPLHNLLSALIVFILAGFLGLATFNLPVKEPLLPLLTGLFGASALITSMRNQIELKKQKIAPLRKIRLEKKELKKSLISMFFIAPVFSFLPALGSGYSALTSSEFFSHSRKGFLFISGAINTIIMALSFAVIYTIGKARTGAAAAVQDILKTISLTNITVILVSIVISGALSFILAVSISKFCAKNITKINYGILSMITICLLIFAVLIFSNILGLIVFITSTFLGTFAILNGSKRIHLMGSLLIPTIIYYLI